MGKDYLKSYLERFHRTSKKECIENDWKEKVGSFELVDDKKRFKRYMSHNKKDVDTREKRAKIEEKLKKYGLVTSPILKTYDYFYKESGKYFEIRAAEKEQKGWELKGEIKSKRNSPSYNPEQIALFIAKRRKTNFGGIVVDINVSMNEHHEAILSDLEEIIA